MYLLKSEFAGTRGKELSQVRSSAVQTASKKSNNDPRVRYTMSAFRVASLARDKGEQPLEFSTYILPPLATSSRMKSNDAARPEVMKNTGQRLQSSSESSRAEDESSRHDSTT